MCLCVLRVLQLIRYSLTNKLCDGNSMTMSKGENIEGRKGMKWGGVGWVGQVEGEGGRGEGGWGGGGGRGGLHHCAILGLSSVNPTVWMLVFDVCRHTLGA
jgi:hypothetical protein